MARSAGGARAFQAARCLDGDVDDLPRERRLQILGHDERNATPLAHRAVPKRDDASLPNIALEQRRRAKADRPPVRDHPAQQAVVAGLKRPQMSVLGLGQGSEEPTSELQSLMRLTYAVFCLKHNTYTTRSTT